MGKCKNWTSTLPSELPPWELESQWTFESLESNCRGQNPLDWRVLYIIEKLLQRKCLKWACMTHLDTSNTSYDQKKGRESNYQFDSRSLKFGKRPDFIACKWHATYCWKSLDEGYNFASNLISIEGMHTKLCSPKIARIWTLGISRLSLGSPRTKCHLGVGPVAMHKIYYKGEGGGFPKSGSWWILWIRVYPWLVLAPKMLQLCTNQLVVWFHVDPCE
jgi:hypothetical protein